MDFENNNTLSAPQENYEQRAPFKLSKKDTFFSLLAVLTCIFCAIFGIFGGFAIGYSISIVLINILFISYLYKNDKKIKSSISYEILTISNSAVFVCTTNSSVRFLSIIISFLFSLLTFNAMINEKDKSNRKTLSVFLSAASTMKNIDITIKSLFCTENGSKKTLGKVLIGFLCAIPILIVVVPLLISSDDAFRYMVEKIFKHTPSTVLKTIFGLIVSLFAISYGFSLKSNHMIKFKKSTFSGIENIYIISLLSTVSISYILYLFSQLAYFFSAFKGFLPDIDATYAQYARKGFFEMCAVALINLCLIFLSLLLAKKENGKVCNGLRILLTFISIFTLIIIATAISKMVLYIETYGMTVIRLTTSAFMLFLAIVFISTILRIYIIKINVIKTALISACLIILTLGIANVNAICAKYNYDAFKSNKLKTIDIEAIYNLGDEGIPYILKLGASKDEDVALKAQQYLAKAYVYDYFNNMENAEDFTIEDLKLNEKNKGFSHLSIPRYKAYNQLYTFIDKNPWFASICNVYANELNDNYYVFAEN